MKWIISRFFCLLIVIVLFTFFDLRILLFLLVIMIVGTSFYLANYNYCYPIKRNNGILEYYIDAPDLFNERMLNDSDGIVMVDYGRQGIQYNPAYIGLVGLFALNRYLQTDSKKALNKAIVYAEWLKKNYISSSCGYLWYYYFERYENNTFLKNPWCSAMAQGLCISLLLRVGKLTNDIDMLEIAEKASSCFETTINNGGVKHELSSNSCLYEEYPSYPLPSVLDGSLFALIGLYDLFVFTNDMKYLQLFKNGVLGIEQVIESYNYKYKWSWYGIGYNILCDNRYNSLNCVLLEVVAKFSNSKTLLKYATLWNPCKLTIYDKIEIGFVRFILLEILYCKVIYRAIKRRISEFICAV